MCSRESIFLHSISQTSKQSEVTHTQVRRIWWVIKVYHKITPRFVDDFLSAVTTRVVAVHGQSDGLFLPGQILCMLPQNKQHKANEAIVSNVSFWSMVSTDLSASPPQKPVLVTFEVPIVFALLVEPVVVKHIWRFHVVYDGPSGRLCRHALALGGIPEDFSRPLSAPFLSVS
jgi:hypothetical protein